MTKPLKWEPVRKGNVYCSPACGFNCTHKDYLRANQRGRAMVKALGKGWKFEVWENLGWHVKALKGRLAIHHSSHESVSPLNRYWANFLTRGGQYEHHGRTPKSALKKVLAKACTAAHNILEDTTEIHS